jgi:hypothetical protein
MFNWTRLQVNQSSILQFPIICHDSTHSDIVQLSHFYLSGSMPSTLNFDRKSITSRSN